MTHTHLTTFEASYLDDLEELIGRMKEHRVSIAVFIEAMTHDMKLIRAAGYSLDLAIRSHSHPDTGFNVNRFARWSESELRRRHVDQTLFSRVLTPDDEHVLSATNAMIRLRRSAPNIRELVMWNSVESHLHRLLLPLHSELWANVAR